MSDCSLLYQVFLTATEVVFLQCYLVVAWQVPHEAAAVSVHALCTPCNHGRLYDVTSFKASNKDAMCV